MESISTLKINFNNVKQELSYFLDEFKKMGCLDSDIHAAIVKSDVKQLNYEKRTKFLNFLAKHHIRFCY